MAQIETDKETRQGPLGKPVLYVLIAALVLAAIYLIGTFGWSVLTSPPSPAGQSIQTPGEPAKGPRTPPAAEPKAQ